MLSALRKPSSEDTETLFVCATKQKLSWLPLVLHWHHNQRRCIFVVTLLFLKNIRVGKTLKFNKVVKSNGFFFFFFPLLTPFTEYFNNAGFDRPTGVDQLAINIVLFSQHDIQWICLVILPLLPQFSLIAPPTHPLPTPSPPPLSTPCPFSFWLCPRSSLQH